MCIINWENHVNNENIIMINTFDLFFKSFFFFLNIVLFYFIKTVKL